MTGDESLSILHLCYEYPGMTENCGGGGRVVQTLVDKLRNRGQEVYVIANDRGAHYASYPFRKYREIAEAIEVLDIDVIHGHFLTPTSLLAPLQSGDTPLVLTAMGADVHDPTRYGWIRPALSLVNRYLMHAADVVTVPSVDLQRRLDDQTDTKTCIHIPHGIDVSAYSETESERREPPTNVLTVARLVDRKQLPIGIGAVARARELTGTNLRYRIVGTGPLEDTLRTSTEFHEWVSVDGYVDDIRKAYDWADVFLLPSAHEAFGLVVCEAMASGLPVVCSETGGHAELVTPRVGMTAPDSRSALGEALTHVLRNYPAFESHPRQHVKQNYGAELMADRYENIYKSVL